MRAQVYRIGFWMLMVLLVACHRPAVETRRGTSIQSSELLAVDSLLWTQPDSALTCLMACYDTVGDRHYANLLLAELLYKNDYEQTNRVELQAAVAYYDSVSDPFLAARAHYINGVGYYERDSVVSACEQYLKAVEIMEEHFTEKELVGQKAKFMALAYTHLCGLFSDQYLHEQAIYFGKISLDYYQKYDASTRHIAWIENEIGANYEITGNNDSADYHYKKGLTVLADTNNLTYRDIATHGLFLCYKEGGSPRISLDQLQRLQKQAESENEYLSRCLTIGEIFFHEQLFDSAFIYLNEVYLHSVRVDSKKQAAEWLIEICKVQGRASEIVKYTDFLATFATREENKSNIKSQLAEFYNIHRQHQTELLHKKKLRNHVKCAIIVILGLMMLTLCFFTLYRSYKKKKRHLETKIKEEQNNHEIRQKALAGRLRQSNEALRVQEKKTRDLAEKLETQQRQTEWGSLNDLLCEDICQEIFALLCDKHIKREAKKDAYPELHLSEVQLHALETAVEKHFCGFEKTLTSLYPKISPNLIRQCLLYLLNMEDVQIAALLSCEYTTIKRRSSKLKEAFGTKKEPRQFIKELVLG